MSRPKGSLNKPKLEPIQPINLDALKIASEKFFKQPTHYDLTLSIRAFRDGRFKGLWELSKLKKDGTREIIVDATSRHSVVNMVVRQIMKVVIA